MVDENNYKPGKLTVRKMTPEEMAAYESRNKELREKYPWRYHQEHDPYANYVDGSMTKNDRRRMKK
jgi:hypothetical protein